MAKVILGKDGLNQIPEALHKSHHMDPGAVLVFEPNERGVALHFARLDVQKVSLEVTTACNPARIACGRRGFSTTLNT